jgi:hypothetical protein
VSITSPTEGDAFCVGTEDVSATCTTSTDSDIAHHCVDNVWTEEPWPDPVTHTWSGAGTFEPTTGTSVTWTPPTTAGEYIINVTATDSPLHDDSLDNPDPTDSVTVYVVEVDKIEIEYAPGSWDDVTEETIVVLKGTKYTFKAFPNPSTASWPANSPVWSGVASGTGETIEVTFDSSGIKTLTAKCCCDNEGKTVTINVVIPEPDQIYFVDYTIGEEHNIYNVTDPVWKRVNNPDDPASYTKSKRIRVRAKFWASENLTYVTNVHVDVVSPGLYTFVHHASAAFWPWPSESTFHNSDGLLENTIGSLNLNLEWSYRVPSGTNTWITMAADSGPHKIYRVYDAPTCVASNYTEDHLDWACTNASGASTIEEIADAINSALSGDPPRDPGDCDPSEQSDNWNLLDGCPYYGECDEQAEFMVRVLKLLGISGPYDDLVYASSNSGAGNCLDLEPRTQGEVQQWLIMDFATGAGYNWNAFEGVCVVAGHWYAVWPSKKASDDYDMLKNKLAPEQYWVKTYNDIPPGSSGWSVETVYGVEPLP